MSEIIQRGTCIHCGTVAHLLVAGAFCGFACENCQGSAHLLRFVCANNCGKRHLRETLVTKLRSDA
jgi:hypothetical protein